MEKQIAYSFDKASVKKMLKGLGIAATGGAAIAILNYVGAIKIDNPLLATLIATMTPSLVNAIKEWAKGS